MTCEPTISAKWSVYTAASRDGEIALRLEHMKAFCMQAAEDAAACAGISEADAPAFVQLFVDNRAGQRHAPAAVLSLFVAAVSHMNW